MAKRGRPRKSWEDMKRDGCKPSVWKKRRRETAVPPATLDWLDNARKEDETFKARLKPGESVLREFGGDVFDWRPQHPLTQARNWCLTVSQDENYRCPETRRQCKEFIANLADGQRRDWFADPEGAANITRLVSAFGERGMILDSLTVFDLTEFFADKRPSGEYVLDDGELLGFRPVIIAMLDAAFLALQETA